MHAAWAPHPVKVNRSDACGARFWLASLFPHDITTASRLHHLHCLRSFLGSFAAAGPGEYVAPLVNDCRVASIALPKDAAYIVVAYTGKFFRGESLVISSSQPKLPGRFGGAVCSFRISEGALGQGCEPARSRALIGLAGAGTGAAAQAA